ncbi:MAG: 2-hydroxyacyl-CoA dehydratase [Oscillospiraceae bacterium]|nr:2-hydroxyacyl-CoA dehydratase [Oscillospiraceae bacterium]MBP5239914.1 2-hydroxyacyl-CoA dehydratase [Oscillospiraceae bacterium]
MKDLRHIRFYERLLEQADNELVRQAKAGGGVGVGYTCYYLPEALLNCGRAFSVRLRAPNTGSLDISQYYMTSFICGYARALFERAFEGGFNFLDFYASSDTCQQMVRVVENIRELNLIDHPGFSYGIIDAPMKVSPHGRKLYAQQIRDRILEPLRDRYGVDIGDGSIRKAVREHNELCEIFEEISELRKAENPVITPREFHILCLVSYACPTAGILPYLRETLEDLRQREPDAINPWRARVVVVGGELDDYAFSEILENCRCYVAADRYCFGAFPGRQRIPLREDAPALEQVCDFYLETNQCPRFMSQEKILQRREAVKQLVEDYRADGILYEQPKFCDFWGYERTLAVQVMREDYGIPTLGIDREYVVRGSGQLSTRIQAFMESLEIKKIRKGGGQG